MYKAGACRQHRGPRLPRRIDGADENERQPSVELPVLLDEHAPNSPASSVVERLALPEAFLQCELCRMKTETVHAASPKGELACSLGGDPDL